MVTPEPVDFIEEFKVEEEIDYTETLGDLNLMAI